MRPRRSAVVQVAVVLTMLAGVLGGCGGHQTALQTPAPIRLGALLPMTGRSAPSGTAMAAAAKLAIKEANAAGGVLGRRVELVIDDDACDPATAVNAANDLVAQGITVSVGGYCSSATVPTLRIFRAAGIPMIIPAANSTDLLTPGYDSVFMLAGTVAAEARFAVDQLRRLGCNKLAVVHDGTSFPATLAKASVESAAAAGLSIVANLELSQGAPSYGRIAGTVLSAGADAVYYTGYYGEARQLVVDLRAAGYHGMIVGGDGAIDGQLLDGLSEQLTEHLYGTSLPIAAFMPGHAEWAEHYRAAVGTEPGPNTMEAYDATRLALDAIQRAGSTEHSAVRAAIAATSDLPLQSGKIRFNPDGTRMNPTFLLLAVRKTGFVLVAENHTGTT